MVNTLASLTFLLIAVTPAWAETVADQRGYQIAERTDNSDRGFHSSIADLTMVLRDASGNESTRALTIQTLEVTDPLLGDKSLILFNTPADVRGTALLSHSRILEPDDQWLYLPALRREKRISSANKSGPFVGSEFAFEDFTAQALEKYEYQYLRSEPCGEFVCDVVERRPKYAESGYTRQISWTDQTRSQMVKVEFYDRRDTLLKTLEMEDYREHEGKFWRAHRLTMVNHLTGRSTDLVYSDYRFDTEFSDRDFEKSVLRRIR
ncbi:outer membrane lipoprotein-sorting protein [Microbulbifer sp. CAU 1566]|uniref:outer membrane lipoprotein-sorting protein n=1 Tax=Microbulbifer sp. CAU 1566 TaxID=2933269 RepID=UPI00200487DD|nr:outer membrane lipoprotein-sorting protein [Microbulbifer sp. CAU 1566]MCK7596926.1 outer membrane lipoprotein-sorting protein [Microbulbifer sp. CAU 1566]